MRTEKMMNIINNSANETVKTLENICDLVIEMKLRNIDKITDNEGEVIRIDDLRKVISTLAMLSDTDRF